MARVKLDRIDRRILKELQENGRITNVKLAEAAGISAPPCLRRMRALEEGGFIEGYAARLNAEALGFGVTVFAMVGLDSQADADLKAFVKRIEGWPLVRECHMLAGDYDFLLKIVARDWEAYQHFLTEQLTSAPHVNHVKSHLAVNAVKHEPGVPVALEAEQPLSEAD